MPELLIHTKSLEEDIYLVSLSGILDNETVGNLAEIFHDAFSRNVWKFIVDLSELNYMGSPGVGLFISFIDSLEEHKGTIVFIHPKPTVKEVFKIFKLSNFYSIINNLDDAIKELKDLTPYVERSVVRMTTEILPFFGILYNKSKIKDYGLVLTQPYDKITPKMQNIYYKRHPYNLVRITKGKDLKNDDEHNNKYSRAGKTIEEWLRKRILVQDTKRAIYAYHQEYYPPLKGVSSKQLQVRKGFIALMRLKDFGRGVHPHERTLLKPKQDRLNQMRATGGSTGQIFMLYSDPKLIINCALAKITAKREPDVELRDDYGVINKLWKVADPQIIKIVQDTMKKKDIFIADGHHRYETALNYRDEMRALGLKCTGNESYENRMMTFINMDDKGLTVLPTHRLIFGLNKFSFNSFLKKLQQYFWLNEYPCRSLKEDKFARTDLIEDLKITGQNAHAFGLVVRGIEKYYMLTLKDDKMMEKIITEKHSSIWKRLDVTILHSLILEKLLGITKEQVANEEKVNYVRSEDEAIEKVRKRKYQMAFILNPTKIEEVKKVSIKNERMPQKSTDFYPKLLSGIVISRISYDINTIKSRKQK